MFIYDVFIVQRLRVSTSVKIHKPFMQNRNFPYVINKNDIYMHTCVSTKHSYKNDQVLLYI